MSYSLNYTQSRSNLFTNTLYKTWIDKTWIDKTWINKTWVDKTLINKTWIDKTWINKTWINKTWINKTLINKTWLNINQCFIHPCFINPVHVLLYAIPCLLSIVNSRRLFWNSYSSFFLHGVCSVCFIRRYIFQAIKKRKKKGSQSVYIRVIHFFWKCSIFTFLEIEKWQMTNENLCSIFIFFWT